MGSGAPWAGPELVRLCGQWSSSDLSGSPGKHCLLPAYITPSAIIPWPLSWDSLLPYNFITDRFALSLKGHFFHPEKERKCEMELAEVGPPSGPIFQPGLVELTSPWRDLWWRESRSTASRTSRSPGPPSRLGTLLPSRWVLGLNLPKHRETVAGC